MELGGNKNAHEYYEQNGMLAGGKPDHEMAPHARYKAELAAKVSAHMKANNPELAQQGRQQSKPAAPVEITANEAAEFKQPDSLQNPFDFSDSKAALTQKPVAQA